MWEGVRDAAKKLLSVRKQKGKDGIEGKNTRRENELSDKISQEEDQLRWGRRKSIVPPPPLSPPVCALLSPPRSWRGQSRCHRAAIKPGLWTWLAIMCLCLDSELLQEELVLFIYFQSQHLAQ